MVSALRAEWITCFDHVCFVRLRRGRGLSSLAAAAGFVWQASPGFWPAAEPEFPVYFQRCLLILGDWGGLCVIKRPVLCLYPSVKCCASEMLVCFCLVEPVCHRSEILSRGFVLPLLVKNMRFEFELFFFFNFTINNYKIHAVQIRY